MKTVRQFIGRLFVALLMAPALACAQNVWPRDTVKMIVPASKTAVSDTLARLVAEELSARLNTPFELVHMPDPHGIVGTERMVKAEPDGYTLLFSWAGSLVVSPSLFSALPFDPEENLDAIGLIAEVPNVLVVNRKLPVNTLTEFTRYVHTHPGAVNFGSNGNGKATHLAGQMYMLATDTNMVHVSYSSPEMAMSNLVSGQIQSMFQLSTRVIKPVAEGQIKALGVMARQRLAALPDVPTMAEQGYPSLVSGVWFALSAPQGTPGPVVRALNAAINAMLDDPRVQARLDALGAVGLGGSPNDMDTRMARELEKWRRIVITTDIPIH